MSEKTYWNYDSYMIIMCIPNNRTNLEQFGFHSQITTLHSFQPNPSIIISNLILLFNQKMYSLYLTLRLFILNLFKLRCSKQEGKVAIYYCTFLNRQSDKCNEKMSCYNIPA